MSTTDLKLFNEEFVIVLLVRLFQSLITKKLIRQKWWAGGLSSLNEWPPVCVLWDSVKSWNNVAQNNHLTVWIEILSHLFWTYITEMVNSMMLVNQCKSHLLNMVQALLHAVVHPQVCIDPIHKGVPQGLKKFLFTVSPILYLLMSIATRQGKFTHYSY